MWKHVEKTVYSGNMEGEITEEAVKGETAKEEITKEDIVKEETVKEETITKETVKETVLPNHDSTPTETTERTMSPSAEEYNELSSVERKKKVVTLPSPKTTIIVERKQLRGGDGRHIMYSFSSPSISSGSFRSPSSGMLVLEWDNTYSIFTSKQVSLRLSYTDSSGIYLSLRIIS